LLLSKFFLLFIFVGVASFCSNHAIEFQISNDDLWLL